MGNKQLGPSMLIDRIITNDPYPIYVGVNGEVGKKDNPYGKQVIRVNDGSLKPLVSFTETNNSLIYDFEDNVKLQLTKRDDDIVYHIKTNDIDHTSLVNPSIRKNWKTISLTSNELDKIAGFINPE